LKLIKFKKCCITWNQKDFFAVNQKNCPLEKVETVFHVFVFIAIVKLTLKLVAKLVANDSVHVRTQTTKAAANSAVFLFGTTVYYYLPFYIICLQCIMCKEMNKFGLKNTKF